MPILADPTDICLLN